MKDASLFLLPQKAYLRIMMKEMTLPASADGLALAFEELGLVNCDKSEP